MCVPSSGSSAMDRSSSKDATGSCWKRQAATNASLTAARSLGVPIKRGANGVEISERREEFERAQKQVLSVETAAAALERETR